MKTFAKFHKSGVKTNKTNIEIELKPRNNVKLEENPKDYIKSSKNFTKSHESRKNAKLRKK